MGHSRWGKNFKFDEHVARHEFEIGLRLRWVIVIELSGVQFGLKSHIWVNDQVWGQDGWILAKFFFCVFMGQDVVEVHKRARPISSQLDRTSLVNKGFIIWLSGNFFLRDKEGSPEQASELHLARSGSQSRRIWFIFPAQGAGHIISVFSKSNELAGRVRFEITSMILDQNCATRSSIATLFDPFWNRTILSP